MTGPDPIASPAPGTVDCSVLVPVLNEERDIEAALDAMREQRFDGTLEFVFADGGSTDRTRELLDAAARADPRVRVFPNPRRIVPSGLNVALAHARGRWVARMDAHSVYPPDYLQRGVDRLRAGATTWVSGPAVPQGRGPVSRAVALALSTSTGRSGSRKWAGDATGEYELDTGVFTGVWERRTLLRHGGWDERWIVNEDSEMAARFLAAGERLVCLPAMAARYVPRDSLASLWRQYRTYGAFRVRTAVAHPDSLRRQHLVAPVLVATVVAAVTPVPDARGTIRSGPRALRRAARAALGAYGGVLARDAVRARGPAARPADVARVPLVLATMHGAFGTGMWLGMARFGPPIRAVRGLLGLGPTISDGARPGPVQAPSLTDPSATRGPRGSAPSATPRR